jgi:hypothetical protein
VGWGTPFGTCVAVGCSFPVFCPQGDIAAQIFVTVRDCATNPMAGIPACNMLLQGCMILDQNSPCQQQLTVCADAPTNAAGNTTFTVKRACGCCNTLKVVVNGVTLNTTPLVYRSFDYDCSHAVDLADLGFLATTFNQSVGSATYNACFDFNCDNIVNLADLGYFACHFTHRC